MSEDLVEIAVTEPEVPEASGLNWMQDLILRDLPESVRGVVLAAYLGKPSPRGAIKAKCLECTGGQRQVVKECSALGCPLWRYRPYQGRVRAAKGSQSAPGNAPLPQEATISTDPVPTPGVGQEKAS